MIRHGTAQTSVAGTSSAAPPMLVHNMHVGTERAFVMVLPGAKARAQCSRSTLIATSRTTFGTHHATADITLNTKSP